MKKLVPFFILLIVFLSQTVNAQILDDSTKLVYSAKTTSYVTEEDILTNSGKSNNADTSISGFHNFDFLYNGKLSYQNLGNFGTALGPIYYAAPTSIGKSFGFNSYDFYAYNPKTIKYYDTKSPFSAINYSQSSNGKQYLDAAFAVNVTSRWNVGFDLKKFTSKKIIGQPIANEHQAEHGSVVFFTRFFTKDSIYQILANATFMDHKVFETGGVVRDSAAKGFYYDYKKQPVFLHARSFEKRSAIHIYHQLSPFKDPTIQLFHVFDYSQQSNRFNSPLPALFYPNRLITLPNYNDTTATIDRADYTLWENKIGLKGSRGPVFYRGYFRNKNFTHEQNTSHAVHSFSYIENFVGGDASIQLPIKGKINLSAEFLFARDGASQDSLNVAAQNSNIGSNKNDYQFRAEYVSSYLTVGYHKISYSPTLVQLYYNGNNLFWKNEGKFVNPAADNFYANSLIEWKNLVVNPGVNFSTIRNYIYYDNLAMPTQAASTINYFSADLFLKYNISKIYLENLVKYANADKIIQVPQLSNHARLYYQSHWFKKAVLIQIGVDAFYKTGYYANSYMPITQQFYLNQGDGAFKIPSYLMADFFINARIKSANAFLKFANFNQPFSPGYMITPYYPVSNFNFEFGIRWLFFD